MFNVENFYNPDKNPILETPHGKYKAGESVYTFPNWEQYPMSKMSILCTTEDGMISTGGGMYSVDLVRHTQVEALQAMQQLRSVEIKRILDLSYIHPKMKGEID